MALYLDVFLADPRGGDPSKGDLGGDSAGVAGDERAALDQLTKLLRLRHYSYRTEQTYGMWAGRYFKYVSGQGLLWNDVSSVRVYLSYLALQRKVASSTQNQALSALLFLFQEVLHLEVPEVNAVRAKRGPKLPVVLSCEEVKAVLAETSGTAGLMLRLVYGAGLRVSEAVRLRVQDLDFGNNLLFVRGGKGDKDRTSLLPASLYAELREHLERVRVLHSGDVELGHGVVYLPGALALKYPNAPSEWRWQYVFPAAKLSVDPRGGMVRRHHVSQQVLQKSIHKAVRAAGVDKHATVHTLRHSFATHLLMAGVNIRQVQEYLGHKNVETTMIYTHVMRDLSEAPLSPLDSL